MTTHHSKPEEDVNEWGFGPLVIPEDQRQAMGEPRWVPEPLPTADKKAKKRRQSVKRRPPYTARAMGAYVDGGVLAELTTTAEVKVLFAMVRHMQGNFTVTASRNLLAQQTGLNASSVTRAIKRLTEAGILTREKEGKPGYGSSVYALARVRSCATYKGA